MTAKLPEIENGIHEPLRLVTGTDQVKGLHQINEPTSATKKIDALAGSYRERANSAVSIVDSPETDPNKFSFILTQVEVDKIISRATDTFNKPAANGVFAFADNERCKLTPRGEPIEGIVAKMAKEKGLVYSTKSPYLKNSPESLYKTGTKGLIISAINSSPTMIPNELVSVAYYPESDYEIIPLHDEKNGPVDLENLKIEKNNLILMEAYEVNDKGEENTLGFKMMKVDDNAPLNTYGFNTIAAGKEISGEHENKKIYLRNTDPNNKHAKWERLKMRLQGKSIEPRLYVAWDASAPVRMMQQSSFKQNVPMKLQHTLHGIDTELFATIIPEYTPKLGKKVNHKISIVRKKEMVQQ